MGDGKSAVMARQLDVAQAITHIGSWEWDVATGSVSWSDELYRIYGIEPQSRAIKFDDFVAALHPEDRPRIQGNIEAALQRGGRFSYRERIRRPDGTTRVLDTIGEVVSDDSGAATSLIGTCRDVTEEARLAEVQRRAVEVQNGERRALEQLASGAPLGDVLATIVGFIEALSPDAIASILLLDENGKLRHGAAPHLPAEYNAAIDGQLIGPAAGSCGTAAYRREPVVVADIEHDPLWLLYRAFALPHGLRACWSFPILADGGRVLGTFAVYYRTVRTPDAEARELIARAVHVAGIAIERRQLDDQLRALSDRIESAREDERTSIAREVHDELGQALTALKLDLAWVARRTNGGEITQRLEAMSRATDEILAAVRRISAELRPGILDSVGLRAAIEWQAEDFMRRTGTTCTVRSEIGDLQLDRDLATQLFRIFQEALTNVARHASAKLVEVSLRLERGSLKLDISDDGVGVPEIAPRSSSLGLLGMRERARRCGGDCQIRRRGETGTTVAVTVPLRFPREHDEAIGS